MSNRHIPYRELRRRLRPGTLVEVEFVGDFAHAVHPDMRATTRKVLACEKELVTLVLDGVHIKDHDTIAVLPLRGDTVVAVDGGYGILLRVPGKGDFQLLTPPEYDDE